MWYNMITNVFDFLAELERNVQDEAEARQGYYELLSNYSSLLTEEEINYIGEIISEELKHTVILNEMIEKRSKILPEK